MSPKLQNKGYAESPEFLPALGLLFKFVTTTRGKLDA